MNTPAHIAHQTRDRIRIAIPSRRGDHAYFQNLAEQLAQSGQVRSTRVNPAAASLVVEFGGAPQDMLEQLRRVALDLSSAAEMEPPYAPAAGPYGPWQANPMFLAGAAFGVVGVIQTLRGDVMLPAMSAFWYAANALRLARLPAGAIGNNIPAS